MNDPTANIEHSRQALVRIVAALVAMAGLNGRATLPRRLRNALLRLLRPAESAARRLVIALAGQLKVTPPPARARKPQPLRRRRHFMPVMPPQPAAPRPPRSFALPLLDAPRRKAGPRRGRQTAIPRIGLGPRPPLPPPLSPDDRVDGTRLGFRLDALAAVLAELPKQALRFARWQARQRQTRALAPAGRAALRRPLRWGRPPGTLRTSSHEVHDVLAFAHELALEALRHPDTS